MTSEILVQNHVYIIALSWYLLINIYWLSLTHIHWLNPRFILICLHGSIYQDIWCYLDWDGICFQYLSYISLNLVILEGYHRYTLYYSCILLSVNYSLQWWCQVSYKYQGQYMMGYIIDLTDVVINIVANRYMSLLDCKVIWISHQFYLNALDQIFIIQCSHDLFYWLSVWICIANIYYNTVYYI